MHLQVALVFGLLGASSAFILDFFRPDNWDDLKVTWGPIPFGYFNSMPRTVADATKKGFKKVSDCDASTTATSRGARYVQKSDESLVLLFDKNGYIAGIQTVVPGGLPRDYPKKGLVPPFVKVGDKYHLTAYFTQPDTICSTGRTAQQYSDQGTGTVLHLQTGSNPDKDLMTIPMKESGVKTTKWVKGKCFYSMGQHYWYNISKDMSCDDFFPAFILYNNGELNAFGWALGAHLPSKRLEHPPKSLLGLFFKDPPTCLKKSDVQLSTMHIFLTSKPALDLC